MPPAPSFKTFQLATIPSPGGAISGYSSSPGTPLYMKPKKPSLLMPKSTQAPLRNKNSASPITPVDQIIHEVRTPDAPRRDTRKPNRPTLLTSILSLSLEDRDDDVSPVYPFTPLEDCLPSPVSESSDSTPCRSRAPSAANDQKQKVSSVATAKVSTQLCSVALPLKKKMTKIPRRLSYNLAAQATPSPLALDSALPSPGLASPMTLQATRVSDSASSLHSPAVRVDSPNYFNF